MPTSTLALFIVDGQEQSKSLFSKGVKVTRETTAILALQRKGLCHTKQRKSMIRKATFWSTRSAFQIQVRRMSSKLLFCFCCLFCLFCVFFFSAPTAVLGRVPTKLSHNGLRERQPGTIWAEGGRFMLLFLRAILARFQQFKTLSAERQRKTKRERGRAQHTVCIENIQLVFFKDCGMYTAGRKNRTT